MDNNIDDKLREMAQNSHISMPENFENDMDRLVKQLCAESRRVKVRNHFRKMVLIPMCGILFTSAGVCAAVNYRYQRMEAMSYDERIAYVHELQSTDIQADSYNRDLTEKEKKRLDILKKEYSLYGKFPTSELLRLANNKWVVSNKLCFVSTTSTFYFPDRQMNDEELLQLIDFYYKRDYSIYSYASAKKTEVFQEASKISEDEAVEIGIDIIKEFFEQNVSNYSSEVGLIELPADKGNEKYSVEFTNDEEMYFVSFYKSNGAFYEIFRETDRDNKSLDKIKVDNEKFKECVKDVEDNFIEKVLCLDEVKHVFIRYDEIKNKQITEDGAINIGFEMEDGRLYLIGYDINNSSVFSVSHIEDINIYLKNSARDARILEESGIIRKEIQIR